MIIATCFFAGNAMTSFRHHPGPPPPHHFGPPPWEHRHPPGPPPHDGHMGPRSGGWGLCKACGKKVEDPELVNRCSKAPGYNCNPYLHKDAKGEWVLEHRAPPEGWPPCGACGKQTKGPGRDGPCDVVKGHNCHPGWHKDARGQWVGPPSPPPLPRCGACHKTVKDHWVYNPCTVALGFNCHPGLHQVLGKWVVSHPPEHRGPPPRLGLHSPRPFMHDRQMRPQPSTAGVSVSQSKASETRQVQSSLQGQSNKTKASSNRAQAIRLNKLMANAAKGK